MGQPLDALVLGPFEFTDFAIPDRLPFGGKQHMVVHKMPGGSRVIDCMGPDDDDRTWSGRFWGDDALSKALSLDALRIAGVPLPYSNGVEGRLVVISSFSAKVQRFNSIEYDITITPVDNPAGGLIGAVASLASRVVSDLSAARGLLS